MNFLNLLLAEKVRPEWVVNSFPIIRIVLVCLIGVCAISMIILVLAQESSSRGASAITGEANTFYNRNKGKSLQGKIKKLTIFDATLLLAFCIIYIVIHAIYAGF